MATTTSSGFTWGRASRALRHPGNWAQLAKFCAVGASGYVVNLAVFTLLVRGLDCLDGTPLLDIKPFRCSHSQPARRLDGAEPPRQ